MEDEKVSLIEETNDGEVCWMHYVKESKIKADESENTYINENSRPNLVFIDSSELVANDGNDMSFQYIEDNGNDVDRSAFANTFNNNEVKSEYSKGYDLNIEEKMDNDFNNHTLMLRETIDENGELVEGYFCQQCNSAFNTVEDFFTYHTCSEILNEHDEPHTEDAVHTSTGDELWDLVENVDEEEDAGSENMEIKPNINSVDMENERYFCCRCQAVLNDLYMAENHDCTNDLQSNDTVVESSDNVYRCHLCDKDYSSLRSFSNHQRWHRKMEEQLGYTKTLHKVTAVCEICNTVFESEKNLKLHMKMHKKHALKTIQDALPAGAQNEYNELNQFFCEICNKSFDQKLLIIHKNMHQNVEEYVCGKCNKQFENLPSYEIHLQMHVDNMNNVKTLAAAKSSQKVKATDDGPSTSSQTSSTVRADGKRKHACQYCGKEFLRPYEKVKHERIHTGEKPYECEVCGKTFRVSYSLTLHLRTHTDIRPYVCATCNKRFKQQSVYVHHLKTHANERGYKCNICGKSFRTSVQLSGHKNIHSKPYNCTECNRPFASLYAVKIHMKTHNKCHKSNKNLKNRCSICGASYARLFALRFHIKEQHGIDLDPTQLLEAATNRNYTEIHKDMDTETVVLLNAANEAKNQQVTFFNVAGDEEYDDIDRDSEEDDEGLENQVDHEENIENSLTNTNYLDETEAATQTILNPENVNAENFHTEEIITDWLTKE